VASRSIRAPTLRSWRAKPAAGTFWLPFPQRVWLRCVFGLWWWGIEEPRSPQLANSNVPILCVPNILRTVTHATGFLVLVGNLLRSDWLTNMSLPIRFRCHHHRETRGSRGCVRLPHFFSTYELIYSRPTLSAIFHRLYLRVARA
jgi:hypothetical protein